MSLVSIGSNANPDPNSSDSDLQSSTYSPSASVASVRTLIGYDALGRVLSRTEAAGRAEQRTTSYEYDAAGRQVRTIYPAVPVYSQRAPQRWRPTGGGQRQPHRQPAPARYAGGL